MEKQTLANSISNNAVTQMIFTTIIFSLLGHIGRNFENIEIEKIINKLVKKIFRYNIITLHGTLTTVIGNYSEHPTFTFSSTDKFHALCHYINKLDHTKNKITEIKEIYSYDQYKIENNKHFFIVIQKESFIIDSELNIYGKVLICEKENDNAKKNNSIKIENIQIEVYSPTTKIEKINKFLSKIEDDYLLNILNSRCKTQFIYTLGTKDPDKGKYDHWNEYPFKTTKSFDNVFFDEKKSFINRVLFFNNNKKWYEDMGVPYTLGIALHGIPGSGKTTIIKCLAKELNRHIIYINAKLLKTRELLYDAYFENTYNCNNKLHSIDFSKKIIVFEDIDCIGDFILDRKYTQKKENTTNYQKINIKKSNKDNSEVVELTEQDPVTLDDVLNLWDGVRENDGRILIITSNHYDKLDSAIKRPGRIDIELKLNHASIDTINNISKHFFGKGLPKKKQIRNKYSPAEITQKIINENNYESFIKSL